MVEGRLRDLRAGVAFARNKHHVLAGNGNNVRREERRGRSALPLKSEVGCEDEASEGGMRSYGGGQSYQRQCDRQQKARHERSGNTTRIRANDGERSGALREEGWRNGQTSGGRSEQDRMEAQPISRKRNRRLPNSIPQR